MARCRAGSLLRVLLLAALLLAALAALAAGARVAPAGAARGDDALALPAGPVGKKSSVKCKTCKKFLAYALDVIDSKYTRATIEAFLIAVRSPPPPILPWASPPE